MKQIGSKDMKSISQLIPIPFLLFTTLFFFTQWSSFFSFLLFSFHIQIFSSFVFFFSLFFFISLGSLCHRFYVLFDLPPQLHLYQSFFIQEHALQGLINKKGWYLKQERIYRMNYHWIFKDYQQLLSGLLNNWLIW